MIETPLIICCLIFMPLTAGIAYLTISILLSVRRQRQWGEVEGVVEESATTVADEDALKPGDTPYTHYTAFIQYRYQFKGKTYQSTRLFQNPFFFTNPRRVAKYLSGMEVGKRVRVFVDPKKPEIAVLRKGMPAGGTAIVWLVLLICGLTFAGLILAILENANLWHLGASHSDAIPRCIAYSRPRLLS